MTDAPCLGCYFSSTLCTHPSTGTRAGLRRGGASAARRGAKRRWSVAVVVAWWWQRWRRNGGSERGGCANSRGGLLPRSHGATSSSRAYTPLGSFFVAMAVSSRGCGGTAKVAHACNGSPTLGNKGRSPPSASLPLNGDVNMILSNDSARKFWPGRLAWWLISFFHLDHHHLRPSALRTYKCVAAGCWQVPAAADGDAGFQQRKAPPPPQTQRSQERAAVREAH